MPPAAPDAGLQRLGKRELHARYTELQQRAQTCFEQGLVFEQANAAAAPLIAQADAVATEIVRRARRNSRRAWLVVYVVGLLVLGLIAWMALQR